jgi:hypothetical protein
MKVFLPRLRYAYRAANLGCVETAVGLPCATSDVRELPTCAGYLGAAIVSLPSTMGLRSFSMQS